MTSTGWLVLPNTYEAPGCQETNYPMSGFFLFFRLPGLA
jgi:hypothetical protein